MHHKPPKPDAIDGLIRALYERTKKAEEEPVLPLVLVILLLTMLALAYFTR